MDNLFRKMAIILVIGFFIACGAGLVYFALFAKFPPVEMEENFTAPPQKTIVVDNPGGLTHFVGAERADIQVNAQRMVIPRLPFLAQGALNRFQVLAKAEADRYHITARTPSAWRGSSRLEVQIEAPPTAAIVVNTGSGNVNVYQWSAPVEIVNHGSGTIVLEHVSGPVSVTAEGGEIRANLVGDRVPVKINVKSGQVLLNLFSTTPGPLDLNIENGIVVLKVRSDVNAQMNYRTNGTVTSPFPTGRAEPQPGNNHPYAVKLGAGGAVFNITAGQADLTIDVLTPNQ